MDAVVASDLSRYIAQLKAYPVLGAAEERALAVRYHEHGDVDAARALVLGNLRFALKIALEYKRWAPVMDLVQEANLGLMEAVRRFNPYRGYRLVTYAVWWIRAFVQKYLVESQSIVRRGTTRDQRRVARKLGATRRAIEQETGAEAGIEELAAAMEVSPEAVVAMARGSDLSLDAPLRGGGDDRTLGDVLPGDEADPEAQLLEAEERATLKRALADVLEDLDDREREILSLRLLSEQPRTLQELADEHQISRERVRQIEDRVRRKLATALAKPGRALPGGKKPDQ